MSGSSELLLSGRAIKQEEEDVPKEGLSTGQSIKDEPPLDHGCLTEALAVLICTEENVEEESDSGECDDISTERFTVREIKEEADDVPPQDLSTDENVAVEPRLEHEWETETSPPSTTWICPEENTGAESSCVDSCVDSSSPTGETQSVRSRRRGGAKERACICVRSEVRRKAAKPPGRKARRRLAPPMKTWHKCSECHRRFQKSSALQLHQLTHTAERTHLCPLCGTAFLTANGLSHHQRTGRSPYKCRACAKSFGCRPGLLKHQASHAGEMIYECVHCLRTFPQASLLALHRKRHTYSGKILCQYTVSRVLPVSGVSKETSAL